MSAPAPVPASLQLENNWCELTSIGLKLKRRQVTYRDLEYVFKQLLIIDKGHQLAIGDVMALGNKEHGEKWAQAITLHQQTGMKPKTLYEYRRVAENIPFALRMANQHLDYTHYKVIADQPVETRASWIQKVAETGWTIAELKQAIREVNTPLILQDSFSDYLDPQYKSFLLDYIAKQYEFLNTCRYEPFKREIEHTIRAAKFQHTRTPNSDYEAVKDLIDKLCTTPQEMAEEISLSEAEIKCICKTIIEQEPHAYEWRPIGTNTEMARGGRAMGIFRKDAPHYESNGHYHPSIEWET